MPDARSPETPAPRPRSLGVPDIVFFIVAASAPLTVAAGGISTSYAVTGIEGIPLSYLVLAAVLIVFTVGYAAMSRHIANSGAFYAYIAHGLGRQAGVGASFVALVAYNAMQIGVYGMFGAASAQLCRTYFGFDVPWWAGVLAAVIVVGVLGVLRVDLNARVLAVLLILETVAVAVFDVAGLADPGPGGVPWAGFAPSHLFVAGVGAVLCFGVAGFVGFESAAIYGEECRDPKRTVARATYVAVGIIGVFYAVSAWAIAAAAGGGEVVAQARQQGPNLVFALGEARLGRIFTDVATVLFVTSLFASLLSFHNAVARYLFALGREGVLPRGLSATSRAGAPRAGSLTQTVVAVVVLTVFAVTGRDPVLDLFTWLTNAGAAGVILLMALTSFAVVGYFRRDARGHSPLQRLLAPGLAGLALGGLFVLVLVNFDVMLGTSPGSPLRWILPGLILVAGLAGVAWGARLRAARPDVYAVIGRGAAAGE
ncbi:APC family permease [Amycolatopsis sp. NPDC059027]|uniref:APC family permease n=1 Tax=Amycolatopsis sp. NPDC059027 TaxID=3346709 RepID=UPI00366C27B4